MHTLSNITIHSQSGRSFLLDLFYQKAYSKQPIAVFVHGFKGFKDWGHWHLVAQSFADAGIAFLKFNLSHNGTTTANPLDFDDLEAFGQNNYSKELQDINHVLNWLHSEDQQKALSPYLDLSKIILIGHSRGGGISIIKAQQDTRVQALITWASVDRLNYLWHKDLSLKEQWKSQGVHFIRNGRTKQNMPLYYQLVEDFETHTEAYSIEHTLRRLKKPMLILHGKADPAVPFSAAENLHRWKADSQIHLIENADHVFGAKHPYTDQNLTAHSKELIKKSINFIKDC